MVSSRLPEQQTFITESDVSSPVGNAQGALHRPPDARPPQALIEHGFNCLERGLYAEGAAFFALAREQVRSLASLQIEPLVAALETLNSAVTDYLLAHKALIEASKRLAASDIEQQAQIAALRKLLPALAEADTPSPKTPSGEEARKTPRTQPLRLIRPSDETVVPLPSNPSRKSPTQHELPSLYITCFGRFEVRRGDASGSVVSLCSNAKGQALLRYLIAQPKHRETVERLMTNLWPEETPEAAQHKLRVAISALRTSLNRDVTSETGGGYILCKGQVYQLNPAVALHSDVDAFLSLYAAGQKASGKAAIAFYEQACDLYNGPFLAQDIYEEWSFIRREELAQIYVTMCDRLAEFGLENGSYEAAAGWANAMLKIDRCDEQAHRQLMRAYAAQKRRSEALRQYQQCQRILSEELGVDPMPETQRLFQSLLKGQDTLPIPSKPRL